MSTEKDYQSLFDRIAGLRETLTDRLGADLIQNPQLADALTKQIDDMLAAVEVADARVPPPPDKGLAQLIGVGPEAATQFGTTRIPQAGDCSAGFSTTALPVASAPAVIPQGIAIGKFHGAITAATPRGK